MCTPVAVEKSFQHMDRLIFVEKSPYLPSRKGLLSPAGPFFMMYGLPPSQFWLLSKAWSKSAMMSSTSSMPTDTLTKSGVTPAESCSSGLSCWCVVVAGWMTSVLASPMLARCEASLTLSMNFDPAVAPPLMPKPRIAPAPLGNYFSARSWSGWSGSPG